MSRFGEIRLDWGGEEDRLFRLKIGQIGRLQEKTGAGPLGIGARCQVSFTVLALQAQKDGLGLSLMNLANVAEKSHVREVFLQGLAGAGMALPDADKLVREWVDERPLSENLVACIEICNASTYGVDDEAAAGEPVAEAEDFPNSQTESSASAKTESMPSVAPATTPPPLSTR